MQTSAQAEIALSGCVSFAELGDEAVLLNVETGVYFGLDAVGARIWTLFSQGLTNEQVHACLCDEYEADPARLWDDLVRFVHQLEECGLVTRSPLATAR